MAVSYIDTSGLAKWYLLKKLTIQHDASKVNIQNICGGNYGPTTLLCTR